MEFVSLSKHVSYNLIETDHKYFMIHFEKDWRGRIMPTPYLAGSSAVLQFCSFAFKIIFETWQVSQSTRVLFKHVIFM